MVAVDSGCWGIQMKTPHSPCGRFTGFNARGHNRKIVVIFDSVRGQRHRGIKKHPNIIQERLVIFVTFRRGNVLHT